ncbi:RloB family protein [Thiobaca trueperi]|uniref:RloB-like protein n=1 Tax=Thiobaca trueperi TaxID=127458 RepID=A0A4R3N7I9_9GAMM|nr:RloB family protein [Thiobaca trueperi]TCT22859.1 RloB-like protein [Thiobaca trueperi]
MALFRFSVIFHRLGENRSVGGSRRKRVRQPARGAARRSPRRRLLLVCEGQVSEPEYFKQLKAWVRNNLVEIKIASEHGVPLTLVRQAEWLKLDAESEARSGADSFLAYDEVWCVFDVDEHPKINEARQLAHARGIELAVSNPCFELWLLLHFRESPGARHRHDVQRMMREHIPSYDKHLDFKRLSTGIADAARRARRLDDEANEEGESGRNPTTGVYRLTESIERRDSI